MGESNCYGCRFALDARKLFKGSEQVRCKKAEELFGGERWVDVKRGDTGELLNSECGKFEDFAGDTSRAPSVSNKRVVKHCTSCKGTGKKRIIIVDEDGLVNCPTCNGKGKLS